MKSFFPITNSLSSVLLAQADDTYVVSLRGTRGGKLLPGKCRPVKSRSDGSGITVKWLSRLSCLTLRYLCENCIRIWLFESLLKQSNLGSLAQYANGPVSSLKMDLLILDDKSRDL